MHLTGCPVKPLHGRLRQFLRINTALWAVVLSAVAFCGPESRATLLGAVTQPGGPVPSASVTVTNTETGVRATVKADREGKYLIPFLTPGVYRMRVEHPAFQTYERNAIRLRVMDRIRVDVHLKLAK